ncbi:MAG: hypothetical protein ACRDK5_00170 [Solirubrobacterales bacterium]
MTPEDRPDQLPILGTLAEALHLYRAHWKPLVPLGLAVLLPQAIIDATSGGIEIDRLESLGDYLKLLAIPFTVVFSLAGEALLAGVITALVLQWRLGHRLPKLLTFVGTLAWVRLIAVDVLLAVGAAIGVILLIVPGLLFLAYFSIAPAVIEIEDRRIGAAMKRSARLVHGRVGRVFILVVGVILITEGLAQVLLALFHGFLPQLASEVAVDALLESIQGLVIALVAISLIELHGEQLPAPPLERSAAPS